MPTRPPRCSSATNSSAESAAGSSAARSGSRCGESGSTSISIASTNRPEGWGRGAIATTRPSTGACRVADTKPTGSATT